MAPRKNVDFPLVLQTAIAIADESGFESVTLASVAEKLGIRIPSLYNHISGLPGLRYEMTLWGTLQLGETMRRAAVGKSGDAAVTSVSYACRDFALAHPGIYPVTQNGTTNTDQVDLVTARSEAVDVLLIILEPYGFVGDDQLHAVRVLRSALHGFIHLEASGGFGLALNRDESFRQLVELLVTALHTRMLAPK